MTKPENVLRLRIQSHRLVLGLLGPSINHDRIDAISDKKQDHVVCGCLVHVHVHMENAKYQALLSFCTCTTKILTPTYCAELVIMLFLIGIWRRVARLRLRNSEGIYRDPFFRYSILDAEHRLPTDEKVIPSCYSDVKSGDIVGSFYYLPW